MKHEFIITSITIAITSYIYIYIVVIPYVPSSSLLQYLRSNKSLGFIPLHIYDEIILIRKLLVIITCLMCELYVN